jgi:hypothetical protein
VSERARVDFAEIVTRRSDDGIADWLNRGQSADIRAQNRRLAANKAFLEFV